jgi:CubicO group peptidase (beta-lactamase class C family)
MSVATLDRVMVEGYVTRGFEAVRDAFEENFARRGELGGACCAYYRGEKIVDLWGGVRNRVTGEPWERDTMVVVHSATKGLAAMTLAIAHSRSWMDYEERVATFWPEFAQHGKEEITVRQLLAHQAGLFAFDELVDRRVVADLDRLAEVMARHRPAWEPGTRQAYHALTLGFYEGELLRRVDPRHRTLGQFFYDEISAPLGEDVYIRLPEEVPNSRLAILASPGRVALLLGFPLRLTLEGMNPRSNIYRALVVNPERVGVPRRAARLRAQSRSAVRQRGGHGARHRSRLQRLRQRRTRAGVAAGDPRSARGPSVRAEPRLLRRVHEGARHRVLTGLHEVVPSVPIRQRRLVRRTGCRRRDGFCGSRGRYRLCLRDEPDGDHIDRRHDQTWTAGSAAARGRLRLRWNP